MTELNTYPVPGEPPVLSQTGLKILQSRYLIKDEHGKCIEIPAQLFSRVASLIAQAEVRYGAGGGEIRQWHRKYYDLMASLKFLPNSPALMNAQRRGTLSACFVLPVEDSIEGIFEAIKQTALIQQAGGGTGFSFDKLRPTGDRVASSGGTTSGPISFWRIFSETTNAIQQGAFRRGANMGMMSLDHPDILKFLQAKKNLKAFTNFNISVKVTDSWMKKVLDSAKDLHIVKNPRTQEKYLLPRNLDIESYTIDDLHKYFLRQESQSQRSGKYYTVGDVWKLIVKSARRTGEPGVVFIDRINRYNPTPGLGEIEATNPCGEQPLLPYEACTLGSINLTRFVNVTKSGANMDWPALAETVKLAVRFLDNIIDACDYPVRDTIQLAQANRKIGLGVMGCADCLFMLEIPYDSAQGVLVFFRRILDGSKMLQVNPIFKKVAESNGFYNEKLEKEIIKTGSIQNIAKVPAGIRQVFKCAYDISPEWHIRMQAAFQEHCDAAVSKTINLGEKATVATVDKAYKLAYELGCKGVTIYRRHSRADEPMSLD